MKIEFTTNPKAFEVANYILAQGIESLKDNPEIRKSFKLTKKDLEKAEVFRNQLLKGFKNAHTKT